MTSLQNDIQEITLLNKHINQQLILKGGATNDIKNICDKNKTHCFWIFFITTWLILYNVYKYNYSLIISNSPISNSFIGGASKNDDDYDTDQLDDNFISSNNVLREFINTLNKSVTVIYYKTLPYRVIIWTSINIILCVFLLFATPIIENGMNIPCFGCNKSTTFFKCLPGTGHGSIGCSVYKKILIFFSNLFNWIIKIKNFIRGFISFIKKATNKIKNIIYTIYKEILYVIKAPADLLNKLIENGLPLLDISSDWEIDISKVLLGETDCDINDCIYNKDGTIKEHGANFFFKTFFWILKEILYLPDPFPKLDWSLSGGQINKLSNKDKKIIKQYKNEEINDKKHKLLEETIKYDKMTLNNINKYLSILKDHLNRPEFYHKLKEKDKKNKIYKSDEYYNKKYKLLKDEYKVRILQLEKQKTLLEENLKKKNKDYDRNILYINFIKLLTKIKFNPIENIAYLVNKIIIIVNKILQTIIIKPLSIIISAVISVCSYVINTMISILKNTILKDILKPIKNILPKIKSIPITIYKLYTWISDVGISNFILYGFIETLQSQMGNIMPYIGVIILACIILTILIICPLIGLYSQISNIFYIFIVIQKIISSIIFYIIEYIINMKESIDEYFKSLFSNFT